MGGRECEECCGEVVGRGSKQGTIHTRQAQGIPPLNERYAVVKVVNPRLSMKMNGVEHVAGGLVLVLSCWGISVRVASTTGSHAQGDIHQCSSAYAHLCCKQRAPPTSARCCTHETRQRPGRMEHGQTLYVWHMCGTV